MRWLRAAVIACSTYTKIPMPQANWDKGAMRLAIGFLPLAGVLVGGAAWGWYLFCAYIGISAVFFAAIAALLPIVITGGIHMDGYCDTADALASYQSRERRLEILADPHVGAFAAIRLGVYLLASFGLYYELYLRGLLLALPFLYVLSRALAATSALTMPNARGKGMLAAFTERADRKRVGLTLALFALLACAGWLCLSFPFGVLSLALSLPLTLWYRRMARKNFGGVTGDTTGYYIQQLELVLLSGLLIGGLVAG